MIRRLVVVVLLVCGAGVGCRRQERTVRVDPLMDVFRRQARQEGLSDSETSGKRTFAHYCATCHGDMGEGDGQNSYNLDPAPPDFRVALRQDSPELWEQVIQDGTASIGRSPLCPPWGRNLDEQQIAELMAYLRVLAHRPPPKGP